MHLLPLGDKSSPEAGGICFGGEGAIDSEWERPVGVAGGGARLALKGEGAIGSECERPVGVAGGLRLALNGVVSTQIS